MNVSLQPSSGLSFPLRLRASAVKNPIPLLIIAAFVTGLLWAKSRDPFRRIEFSVTTAGGTKVKGMAVLPRKVESGKRKADGRRSLPVVVYLHGAGGSLLSAGKDLRLIAEQGAVAVGLEYNQTNQAAFDEEFIALYEFLEKQSWAATSVSSARDQVSGGAKFQIPSAKFQENDDGKAETNFKIQDPGSKFQDDGNAHTNGVGTSNIERRTPNIEPLSFPLSSIRNPQSSSPSTAWVGFSLGAQRQLSFLLRHPEYTPELVVRISGGMVEEVSSSKFQVPSGLQSTISHPLSSKFLLVHGENDEVFPVADCRNLADVLRTNGAAVDLRVFAGQNHGFGENRSVVMRGVAEYCVSTLYANFANQHEFPETTPGVTNEAERRAVAAIWETTNTSSPRPSPPLMAEERGKNAQELPTIHKAIRPHRLNVRPIYLHYWIPFAALAVGVSIRSCLRWRRSVAGIPRGKLGTVLLCLAWILGIVAVLDTAFHLGLPRLEATESRLNLARRWLMQPKQANDFDWLLTHLQKETKEAEEPELERGSVSRSTNQTKETLDFPQSPPRHDTVLISRRAEPVLVVPSEPVGSEVGAPLRTGGAGLENCTVGTLLEHVELADYNRGLVNWQVPDDIYRDYVLSPDLSHQPRAVRQLSAIHYSPSADLDWRRPLWENFYPRIRKESDPLTAAQIVVRFLRERVTVVPGELPYYGIRSIWETELTDAAGFDRIYVAALRSAGIPARLNEEGRAEVFADGKWTGAPRPIIASLLPMKNAQYN